VNTNVLMDDSIILTR